MCRGNPFSVDHDGKMLVANDISTLEKQDYSTKRLLVDMSERNRSHPADTGTTLTRRTRTIKHGHRCSRTTVQFIVNTRSSRHQKYQCVILITQETKVITRSPPNDPEKKEENVNENKLLLEGTGECKM